MGTLQLRKLSFRIINSSTLLLPAWQEILRSLKLSVKNIPRDVATRWNSTYDMLSFALEYRTPIATISGDRRYGLRQYELTDEEWGLAEELCSVLKVRT